MEVKFEKRIHSFFTRKKVQAVKNSLYCLQINLGTIFILRKDYGWVGGPENGNFPLLYVVKMSLRRWVGGSKRPQNTLT